MNGRIEELIKICGEQKEISRDAQLEISVAHAELELILESICPPYKQIRLKIEELEPRRFNYFSVYSSVTDQILVLRMVQIDLRKWLIGGGSSP